MSPEVLNPNLICEGCWTEWTSDGEWVMDVYRCPNEQEYCLNCCECEEHDTELEGVWYE